MVLLDHPGGGTAMRAGGRDAAAASLGARREARGAPKLTARRSAGAAYAAARCLAA